jgi:formate dehydrogenase major subunit
VPGLGTSFGRGGATDYQQDLQNSDCIVIMGSNMAENHPVGFQWVLEARERGAKVFHVDPRFTRTSAMATGWVGIRAGSDIAFLGGIVNYILEHERWFDAYVRNYTNAPVLIEEDYGDTEELDGLFSGWDPETKRYDVASWQYEDTEVESTGGKGEQVGHGGGGRAMKGGEPPHEDPTLQHPRCVFQILKRHFARYTPELVADACGCTAEQFLEVAEALCDNSGPERTSAFAYAVGWTQHTVGVQTIRTAAIIQLLLGNMGRTGGGILALRGHASIQGSTDIPTLYNILPAYIAMPQTEHYDGLADWMQKNASPTGWWGHVDWYTVSLLKAWWGDAATEESDYCFDYLPRIDDDHSAYWTTQQMLEGKVKGYIVAGENPVVGSANAKAQRQALAQLDWLVVRDIVEIESAAFWYDSEDLQPEQVGTEVFFLPASTHVEKDGSFTNTQRLLQWHYRAVEPKGDARSDLWFYYHLGRLIREKLKGSDDPRDRPLLDLTWQYPTTGELEEPSAEAVLAEINGWNLETGEPLSAYKQLRADGTTACGCWIYCGVFADGVNQAARRKPHWEQDWIAKEWAWAWPANRRILYNRASADPDGKPWSERKRLVWWDEQEGTWTGFDTPDFDADKPPDYRPKNGAKGPEAIAGHHPFIMQADGRGWLFVPQGLEDGPLPAHYEPEESPVANPLYGQRANPRRDHIDIELDPTAPMSADYPYVATTYRLTEHHTAGGMSRTIKHLAELQPAMFVEVHPELAAERGLTHKGWATVSSARGEIEARVLVTRRVKAARIDGRVVHQVGLPYHWGSRGYTTGDAANELLHLTLDPNVHIQEAKGFSVDIRPGRRKR